MKKNRQCFDKCIARAVLSNASRSSGTSVVSWNTRQRQHIRTVKGRRQANSANVTTLAQPIAYLHLTSCVAACLGSQEHCHLAVDRRAAFDATTGFFLPIVSTKELINTRRRGRIVGGNSYIKGIGITGRIKVTFAALHLYGTIEFIAGPVKVTAGIFGSPRTSSADNPKEAAFHDTAWHAVATNVIQCTARFSFSNAVRRIAHQIIVTKIREKYVAGDSATTTDAIQTRLA